jgi:hypothetical protein
MSRPSPAELNGQVHPARNRRTVIGFGLIAFAVLITYGNTLKSEFIHDDKAEILRTHLSGTFHIREIFTSRHGLLEVQGTPQLSSNYIDRFNI